MELINDPVMENWVRGFSLLIIGMILNYVVRQLWYLMNFLKTQGSLKNKRYIYHYSISPDYHFQLYEQKIKIRALFNKKYRVKIYKNHESNELIYKGRGFAEGANLIFNLKSTNQTSPETFYIRIERSYHDESHRILGLYSGVHFKHGMITTICLISPKRISEEELQQYFEKNVSNKKYVHFLEIK